MFSSTFKKETNIWESDQTYHQEHPIPLGSFKHKALKSQTFDLRILTQGFILTLLPNHEFNKYLSSAYSVQSSVPM